MSTLSALQSKRYDRRAAYFLCKCSQWAYGDYAVAYENYALHGLDMQRERDGHLSCDIATDGESHIVAFAGTDDIDDWCSNLSVNKTDHNGYHLHAGFHDAEQRLFYKLADNYGPELKSVWLTGHSFGGALATLHALRFADLDTGDNALQGCYTFGSPRCMDKRAAAWADQLFRDRHYRVTNGNDIVPRMPTRWRFRHCGHHVHINRRRRTVVTPSPLYLLLDRLLGYRVDLIRDHAVYRYLLPLLVESECSV